ncbi:DVU3141 family protein [Cobetia sp. QF-1]|uniref:DVU3141 family protein n=1 Tax=Cobetia sp. QF-1 TaxID=1969833 RepID=UPI000B5439E1|nr:DVU3141 family protein [Cobetia sp. QF-1]
MTQYQFKQCLPGVARFAATAGLAIIVSGCATSYPMSTGNGSDNLSSLSGAAPLSADISAFLDTASIGGVMPVVSSPWGSNVEVVAGERYFAASGMTCRHLTISNDRDLPSNELACRTSDTGKAEQGTWVTQRLVTGLLEDAR